MDSGRKKRKPGSVRGYFRAVGMGFSMLFRLPVWAIKAGIARKHFRQELYAAGVPREAAIRLSNRYKIGGSRHWRMAES
jgi:hypothetical protein